MEYQSVFKRYEIKFLLTCQQKNAIIMEMAPYMRLDKYGKTTVRNLYYDTDSFLLIRRSIEKPVFKEKLRIRSYKKADKTDEVFVELKKKYNGVVYKRRLALPENDAVQWIKNGNYPLEKCQISNEIDYFIQHYQGLSPKVFLSYEREAFYDTTGSDLRVTFDDNILSRREELALCNDIWGVPLLDDNYSLMEIKTSGGIPLWMTRLLAGMNLYKISFSKYGNVYTTTILGKSKGDILYAR